MRIFQLEDFKSSFFMFFRMHFIFIYDIINWQDLIIENKKYMESDAMKNNKKSSKKSTSKKYFYFFIKRCFDILVSIIGCIFLIPITLIIKIAYMLSGDFHSVIFIQDRIGKDGKHFKFYKFRSMVPDADNILWEYLKSNSEAAREYKINKKLKYDPRITRVGRLIRKVSLDEFPQMINVLKGDMSIIGNRPYLPREKVDMKKYFDKIVVTKPGITGYWQVSGRSDVSFEKRMKLESFYSENCSLKLDLIIFFKTFKVVLSGIGAK